MAWGGVAEVNVSVCRAALPDTSTPVITGKNTFPPLSDSSQSSSPRSLPRRISGKLMSHEKNDYNADLGKMGGMMMAAGPGSSPGALPGGGGGPRAHKASGRIESSLRTAVRRDNAQHVKLGAFM